MAIKLLNGNELSKRLSPVLRSNFFDNYDSLESYCKQLGDECRNALSLLLPFSEPEMEFLNRLLDNGEIVPEILTSDKELQNRIKSHPLLEWKVVNFRRYNQRQSRIR